MKNLFRKKILPLCMVIFLMGSLIPVMSFSEELSASEQEMTGGDNTVSPMSLVTGASLNDDIYMLNNRKTGTWLTGFTFSSNGVLSMHQGSYAEYEYHFPFKIEYVGGGMYAIRWYGDLKPLARSATSSNPLVILESMSGIVPTNKCALSCAVMIPQP